MNNQLKTMILLASLTGLMLWIGRLLGGSTGLIIAFIFVFGINILMYYFSDKIVLTMYRAKEVKKESKIYALVKDVANKARVPMPKVYLIKSKNPNAFATGRDPEHSAVACTEGLLDILEEDEIKGVIAHEIGHVKNRDTLITTVAASIAGVISYLGTMVRWGFMFGTGSRDNDNSIIELIVLAILAPLIATLLQLAISRQREYLADRASAEITMKPLSLASALEKIEHGVKLHPMTMGNATTSSLFIANPFRGNGILNLFSTHPPIAERIKKLKAMKLTYE
ncbi:MAG: zinc metalloprotease HtpX [archaeon]